MSFFRDVTMKSVVVVFREFRLKVPEIFALLGLVRAKALIEGIDIEPRAVNRAKCLPICGSPPRAR